MQLSPLVVVPQLLLWLWVWLSFVCLSAGDQLPYSEFSALNDLYVATNGPSWFWQSNTIGYPWNFTEVNGTYQNPCSDSRPWSGVECSSSCSSQPCNVVSLALISIVMMGSLPESLSNLTALQSLVLNDNFLSGPVPASLGRLQSLTLINFCDNALTSTIPVELQNAHALESIVMCNNQLHGNIPDIFATLPNVSELVLGNNNLDGSLPPSLFQLRELRFFILPQNALTGSLSESIGNWTRLVQLNLAENKMSQHLPKALTQLSQMNLLYLSGNQFSGPIPLGLNRLPALQHLSLGRNVLTGGIPQDWHLTTQLEYLLLHHNMLTGHLPHTLPMSLKQLMLGSNVLTGHIPLNLSSLIHVSTITLNENVLSGQVPNLFTNWTRLDSLDFSVNLLSGSITNDFFLNTPNIDSFFMSENELEGSLPTALLGIEMLTNLQLSSNQLTSSFPLYHINATDFTSLSLNENYLSGPLPAMMCQLIMLQQLSLSNNYFSGSFPSACPDFSHQSFTQLVSVQVSNNFFTGALPSGLVNNQLQVLYLDSNQFSGPVAADWLSLGSQLSVLVMAINCFTGTFPFEVLCSASTKLTQVTLDGLHSASACERRIFSWASSGVFMSNQVYGSLPSCLLDANSAQTLLQIVHLSGNAFTGTLPEIASTSPIQVLSIANNLIVGKLPMALWSEKAMINIDLSFNRLRDVIPSNAFATKAQQNATLSLEVNRLSGPIANGLFSMRAIDILQGNLFDCSLNRANLPVYDPNKEAFSCGSDTTNLSLVVVVSVVIAMAFLLVVLSVCARDWLRWKRWIDFAMDCLARYRSVINDLRTLEKASCALLDIESSFQLVMKFLNRLACVLVLLLLPVYAGLKFAFSSVVYSYVWQVSGAYLSGVVPSLVLFALFSAIAAMMCSFVFPAFTSGSRPAAPAAPAVPAIPAALREDLPKAHDSTHTEPQRLSALSRCQLWWRSYWSSVLVVMGYVSCAVVVNGLYVAIIGDDSIESNLKNMAMIAMSLFKLLWAKLLVFLVVDGSRYLLISLSTSRAVVIALITNVLVPFVAETIISPNCFLYAVQHAPAVTMSVPLVTCPSFSICLGSSCFSFADCQGAIAKQLTIGEFQTFSYVPAFHYSFQCSSSLLSAFVSVFAYRLVFQILFVAILPLSVTVLLSFSANSVVDKLKPCLVVFPMPKIWSLSSVTTVSEMLYLERSLLIQMLLGFATDFSILLSFGVLFPPLGVMVLIWIWIEILLFQGILGFILSREETKQLLLAIDHQDLSISTVSDLQVFTGERFHRELMSGLWTALCLATLLWSWTLFDTLGDAVGALAASGLLLAMLLVPWVFYLGLRLRKVKAISRRFKWSDQPDSSVTARNTHSEVPFRLSSFQESTDNPLVHQ